VHCFSALPCHRIEGDILFYQTKKGNRNMLQLDQRRLGASPLVVPAMGIGIWSWGDTGFWGYQQSHTREDITQAYKLCLDLGLNFFDTAELYGDGASERILGECRREDGRPIIIASKFAPFRIAFQHVCSYKHWTPVSSVSACKRSIFTRSTGPTPSYVSMT
jgi:hypothetical protein